MSIQTQLRLNKYKIGQLSSETLNLSGTTNIFGGFIFESGSTLTIKEDKGLNKILTSDENGKLTLQKQKRIIDKYQQLTIADDGGMLIADWNVNDGLNALLTLNNQEVFVNLSGLTNGMSGDLYVNVTDDSSLTITSDPYFTPSYVDGAYYFDNNKVDLGVGKYHLAFTAGNGWVHVNIAGYNGLTGTYVDSVDFLNHINDNSRHLTISAQTFQGIKTFHTIPLLPNANPTTENQATRKKYVDDNFVSNTTLFDSGKIKTTLLPDSILGGVKYQGTWNADTNNPTIPAAASGNTGHYYKVNVAGSYGGDNYRIGDWIISDGTEWSKVDNTDNVISVNGKDGVVVLYSTDIELTDSDNTTIKTALDNKSNTGHTHAAGDITSGVLTVARGGTGSGTAPTQYTIPYWGTTSALANNANMVWNTTYNTLSIGGSTIDNYYGLRLHRPATTTVFMKVSNTTATTGIEFGLGASGVGRIWHNGNYGISIGTNNTERISISNAGVTDFKVIPTLPASNPTTDNQVTRKAYVDTFFMPKKIVSTNSTTSKTLVIGDAYTTIYLTATGTHNITIPLNSSVAFEIGTVITVFAIGSGTKTIVATGGVTLQGDPRINGQYKGIQLIKRDTNTWLLVGGVPVV